MRIYVDMDGVTAKFEKASLEEMYADGFFLSRKVVPNVIDCLEKLSRAFDVELYILSAVISDRAREEKIAWNKENVPFIPLNHQLYPPYGENKATYLKEKGLEIGKDDILIDDFSPNLHSWPGIGIKIYNGINGTHGTWQGYSVHSNMNPKHMCYQVLGICYCQEALKEEMCAGKTI